MARANRRNRRRRARAGRRSSNRRQSVLNTFRCQLPKATTIDINAADLGLTWAYRPISCTIEAATTGLGIFQCQIWQGDRDNAPTFCKYRLIANGSCRMSFRWPNRQNDNSTADLKQVLISVSHSPIDMERTDDSSMFVCGTVWVSVQPDVFPTTTPPPLLTHVRPIAPRPGNDYVMI